MDENRLIHKLIDVFRYKDNYQLQSSKILSQDMYLLERLYFYGDSRVLETAKKFSIPPSTLTGILNRLEEKGLIERTRSNEDRKLVKISITREGKKVVDSHIREDQVFVQNFFGALDIEDRDQFKELLFKLINSLDKDNIFNSLEGGE